jgi:8-oxo-dGTP pyrophosphatase MutT (NUDIX family)
MMDREPAAAHDTSPLIPLTALDTRLSDEPWPFAEKRRADIAAYWQAALARSPRIWNGPVLIARQAAIDSGVLRARFIRTDFASVIAWRGLDHEDGSRHIFGMPGIISRDGVLLFAVMAGHTYNAGRIYPPGGSLDPGDVRPDGMVDILGSIARELAEETGIAASAARARGLYALPLGRAITIVSFLHFAETADQLEARVRDHLAREAEPEITGLWPVRSTSDITSEMSGFAIEMARFFLARRARLTGP